MLLPSWTKHLWPVISMQGKEEYFSKPGNDACHFHIISLAKIQYRAPSLTAKETKVCSVIMLVQKEKMRFEGRYSARLAICLSYLSVCPFIHPSSVYVGTHSRFKWQKQTVACFTVVPHKYFPSLVHVLLQKFCVQTKAALWLIWRWMWLYSVTTNDSAEPCFSISTTCSAQCKNI